MRLVPVVFFALLFFSVIADYAGLVRLIAYSLRKDTENKDSDITEMCFVTSQFATDTNHTDRIMCPATSAPSLYRDSHAKFFLFTNLKDLNPPKGWDIMYREYLQYNRTITQSRVPKFLGFQDEVIQSQCDVVFYFDGSAEIYGNLTDFQLEAQQLLKKGSVGLTQSKHPYGGGIDGEFFRILYWKKDTKENVAISKRWIKSQPDYSPNITIYQNTFFGYAVRSPIFQKLATYFWGLYSKEEGSWRDQPHWAYSLHHFNITPMEFCRSPKPMFFSNPKREGMNGHEYVDETRL
jgi:hypothetical protein